MRPQGPPSQGMMMRGPNGQFMRPAGHVYGMPMRPPNQQQMNQPIPRQMMQQGQMMQQQQGQMHPGQMMQQQQQQGQMTQQQQQMMMMGQSRPQMMMMQRQVHPGHGQPLPPAGISPSHSVSYGSPGQPGPGPMRRPSGSNAASPAADRSNTPQTP